MLTFQRTLLSSVTPGGGERVILTAHSWQRHADEEERCQRDEALRAHFTPPARAPRATTSETLRVHAHTAVTHTRTLVSQ